MSFQIAGVRNSDIAFFNYYYLTWYLNPIGRGNFFQKISV